jgi:ribosomal silencing factor RsfS
MTGFKVVAIDNYNRENVSDSLVVSYVRVEENAQAIADVLNKDAGAEPSRWHVVYPYDKPLYKFEV